MDELQTLANSEEVKRLNVNVPISLHRRLKVKAAKEGKTMSDFVLFAIWQFVHES